MLHDSVSVKLLAYTLFTCPTFLLDIHLFRPIGILRPSNVGGHLLGESDGLQRHGRAKGLAEQRGTLLCACTCA